MSNKNDNLIQKSVHTDPYTEIPFEEQGKDPILIRCIHAFLLFLCFLIGYFS